MVTLQVFVDEDCWNCLEARCLIAEMAAQFPQVLIEMIDLSSRQGPPDVFAIPTYKLNGKIISLGNPYRQDLRRKIQEALGAE